MKHNVQAAYQKVQATASTPMERLRHVTRRALEHCTHQETEQALIGLQHLRSGLDYQKAPEVALGLNRIYDYCDTAVREGDWGEAIRMLAGLDTIWDQLEKRDRREP
ncbi:MAG: hypothetical protein Q7P63_05730 [Verrucomicrobiota bacterium JB022]|nr:hypothetical protein [Verrucomicrobiota bacterium JB022]